MKTVFTTFPVLKPYLVTEEQVHWVKPNFCPNHMSKTAAQPWFWMIEKREREKLTDS